MNSRTWIRTLSLLQAHEYDYTRWWSAISDESVETPKPVWTIKLRLVVLLSTVATVVTVWLTYRYISSLAAIACAVVLVAYPPLSIVCILTLMRPFESWYWLYTREKIRSQIASYKGLTKIAITGSYGKTTAKDITYTILELHRYSTVTPANLNTIAGLKRHLKIELNHAHRYGIFEMGAYGPGDIDQHASVIQPDWGVITAVGPQHLDRYDSINQILTTKFELADHVQTSHLIVNLDSELIRQHIQTQRHLDPITISLLDSKADYYGSAYTFNEGSIELTVRHQGREHHYILPGFGTARVYAAVIAIAVTQELGIPEATIRRGLSLSVPDPHRLGITHRNGATIIDNTYSSNPDSFHSVMSDIARLPGKKALITPGLIELGARSKEIHNELGKQAAEVFNTIILVGDTDRTHWLATAVKEAKCASYKHIGADYARYWQAVEELSQSHDYVLLENDIPQHLL